MITDRIRKIVADNADRTAVKVGAETISYAELWRRAEEVGDFLRRQGTSPVVLRGEHCIDEMTALAACLVARRAYVPVGAHVPEGRFREILSATGATLVLTFAKNGTADLAASPAANSSAFPAQDSHVEVLTLSELARYRDCEVHQNDNETAYIIFTSGSTGTPKGVPVSYGNLENFTKWIAGLSPLSEYRGAKVLNQASLSFDLSVADVYYALCGGHTWVAQADGFADSALTKTQVFSEEGINVAVLTPSGLKLCLLEETFDAKTIPSLRAVFCCGERLEKKTVRKLFARFPNIAMINAYGPTEATCAVCAVQITREMLDADAELPVGDIQSAATEIFVCDPVNPEDAGEQGDCGGDASGREQGACGDGARGGAGEIVLRGASVFSGYLDGRAGGHFTSEGVNGYRTGDGGFVRDGLLYCTGRRDNQIKYKGYRIETDEIECRILRLPGVSECAVVAPVNEAGIVKTIRAYVVADATESCSGALAEQRVCGELTADEVRKGLAETLPPYMIPKTIEIVGSLPRNKNGKIDRKALVEL